MKQIINENEATNEKHAPHRIYLRMTLQILIENKDGADSINLCLY